MMKPITTESPTHIALLPAMSRVFQTFSVYCIICLTLYGLVVVLWKQHGGDSHAVTSELVFWSAWITMATTGLGVVPFAFMQEMSPNWIAVMNAIAAGMMLSASVGLIDEGLADADLGTALTERAWFRVVVGLLSGVGFICLAKRILDGQEVSLMELRGMDARKACLIMTVMTLHSLSEGVGIGVSYNNRTLGSFISLTMAVHNIPEGVAIAIVMVPRGVNKTTCALYCFLSSLPQPLMAVPAYMFVETFHPLFSVGLGFAAGAMCFVAVFELLHEATETLHTGPALLVTTLSALSMVVVQFAIRE